MPAKVTAVGMAAAIEKDLAVLEKERLRAAEDGHIKTPLRVFWDSIAQETGCVKDASEFAFWGIKEA